VNGEDAPRFHFTYLPPTTADLQQGDLLARTTDLDAVLTAIHPHYRKDDYTHFVVLTQSCDLVRRDARRCKARYTTIAAVRPLRLVLEREIATYQDAVERRAALCSAEHRDRLARLLEQLLNNNNAEYFYLEPEAAVGLHEPSCAFLRLSIALRSSEHYDKLLAARKLSLTDVFQAKLGWLVGNMYSRVGTDDWVPDHATDETFKARIDDILEQVVMWVDAERLRTGKRTLPADADADTIRSHIQGVSIPKRKERVVEAVLRVLGEDGVITDPAVQRRVRNRLINDPIVSRDLRG
jgi:hypothetical protein